MAVGTENNVSVLILYRGDSIRRLYNLRAVVMSLLSVEGVKVYVREADSVNHHITEALLPDGVAYEFVEDKDSILHKTWHFNRMQSAVTTPYIGIWDADVVAYPESITECIRELSGGKVGMALPYSGICLDTSEMIADIFMREQDFAVLDKYSYLMAKLQPHRLTGGAVLMNREVFLSLGSENERYYGWGDDDFDRYVRFYNAKKGIYRSQTPLFHLSHPRGKNSGFTSAICALASKVELSKSTNLK